MVASRLAAVPPTTCPPIASLPRVVVLVSKEPLAIREWQPLCYTSCCYRLTIATSVKDFVLPSTKRSAAATRSVAIFSRLDARTIVQILNREHAQSGCEHGGLRHIKRQKQISGVRPRLFGRFVVGVGWKKAARARRPQRAAPIKPAPALPSWKADDYSGGPARNARARRYRRRRPCHPARRLLALRCRRTGHHRHRTRRQHRHTYRLCRRRILRGQ